MDSLKKKKIEIDAAEPEILSFLLVAFFLVKTWCLHYPQCNLTMDRSVGDSDVLC